MSTGLRAALQSVKLPVHSSNPGLELRRYVKEISSGEENKERAELLKRAAESTPTAFYSAAFARWKHDLDAIGASTVEATVVGRMIVGLSSESVIETSITLHPVYGVPVIPGDALKGLARHYFIARTEPGTERDKHAVVLFGDQSKEEKSHDGSASYVSYFDAWFIPGGSPFALDVLTVHHPGYYSSKGASAPTDFEDPTPVPYVSARGSYLIAVKGPTPQWSEMAQKVLLQALEDWGIGGKTSSGYGRLVRAEAPPAPNAGIWASAPTQAGGAISAASGGPHVLLIEKIKLLRHQEIKAQMGQLANQGWALSDDVGKKAVAEALHTKLIETNMWRDKGLRSKRWMGPLLEQFGD